jgi:hypothetical protein
MITFWLPHKFLKKTTGPEGDVDLAIWQNSPIAK